MKNKNLLLIASLAVTVLLQVSCKKSFFTNSNINPNSPSSVTPNVMLATVEAALAYTQGGDFSRFSGLIDQQLFSSAQQTGAYYTYVITNQDVDDPWGNLYTSTMENDKELMRIADAGGNNAYSGISRIIMAYSLQLGVDTWGKIPYSTALEGNVNLMPTFDNDQALYDTIANLLNTGIAQLSNSDAGVLTPGTEDVMYGGTAASWIGFAHAIKARLYMHQSKNNTTMTTNALAEIALADPSSSYVNAQYIFGTSETTANPVYQFNEQRGYIDYPSSTLAGYMDSLVDPRYTIYFDSTYNDVNFVGLADYYGSISGHIEFITSEELLFMAAEATLRSGGSILTAQNYYQQAITANMTKLGVAGGDMITYLAINGTLPLNTNAAIAQIAFQEYIALFMNPEAWTLWRRTGSPALVPTAGTNGVPRRLLYPNTELQLNGANVPAGANLFTPKIFWDN